MIYLDSSAIVKLVHPEAESAALHAWLVKQPSSAAVSSALAVVEVTRALRRHDPAALSRVPGVLSRVMLVPVDMPVLTAASALVEPVLRSLDAIHVGTARRLGVRSLIFVSYDKRLVATASREGLTVASPV